MSYGMEKVGGAMELESLNFEFNLEFKIQVDFKFKTSLIQSNSI